MTTLERAKRTLAALEEDLAVQVKIYDHAEGKMKRIKTEIELIKSKFGLFTELDAMHKDKYPEKYEREKVN
jgi:hypothetical protein